MVGVGWGAPSTVAPSSPRNPTPTQSMRFLFKVREY